MLFQIRYIYLYLFYSLDVFSFVYQYKKYDRFRSIVNQLSNEINNDHNNFNSLNNIKNLNNINHNNKEKVSFLLRSLTYCDDDYCPFPSQSFYEGSDIIFTNPSSNNVVLKWKNKPKRILFLAKYDTSMCTEIINAIRYLHRNHIVDIIIEKQLYDFLKDETACDVKDIHLNNISNYNDNDNNNMPSDTKDSTSTTTTTNIPLDIFQYESEASNQIDLIITFGGDGLLLHCNSLFRTSPVPPVMCFDFGSLGR